MVMTDPIADFNLYRNANMVRHESLGSSVIKHEKLLIANIFKI